MRPANELARELERFAALVEGDVAIYGRRLDTVIGRPPSPSTSARKTNEDALDQMIAE